MRSYDKFWCEHENFVNQTLMFPSKNFLSCFSAFLATTFNHPFLIYHFSQVLHLATLPYINTFACLKVNQYWTGLECVSYSITQVKSQLREIFNSIKQH